MYLFDPIIILQLRNANSEKLQSFVNQHKGHYSSERVRHLLRSANVPSDQITTLIAAAYPA